MSFTTTVERVLIAWFNDCVLGRSGQIANPIIAMVDPVLYYSTHTRLCFANLLIANAGTTHNSQLIDTRNLKTDLWHQNLKICTLFEKCDDTSVLLLLLCHNYTPCCHWPTAG